MKKVTSFGRPVNKVSYRNGKLVTQNSSYANEVLKLNQMLVNIKVQELAAQSNVNSCKYNEFN